MAVKADNKELAGLLDGALDALRASGELLKIFQAHGLTLAAP
jgi:ABC-type amino acid transport substrate-binding protein